MKQTIIILLAIIALSFSSVFAETLTTDMAEADTTGVIYIIDSDSEPYVINSYSKEKHQLNVKIQFNAITYDTLIKIMGNINNMYGKDAVTDDKKACSIKFIIDGN